MNLTATNNFPSLLVYLENVAAFPKATAREAKKKRQLITNTIVALSPGDNMQQQQQQEGHLSATCQRISTNMSQLTSKLQRMAK